LLLCSSAPPVRVQFALPEAPLVFPRVPVQGPSGGSQGQTRSACSQFVGWSVHQAPSPFGARHDHVPAEQCPLSPPRPASVSGTTQAAL